MTVHQVRWEIYGTSWWGGWLIALQSTIGTVPSNKTERERWKMCVCVSKLWIPKCRVITGRGQWCSKPWEFRLKPEQRLLDLRRQVAPAALLIVRSEEPNLKTQLVYPHWSLPHSSHKYETLGILIPNVVENGSDSNQWRALLGKWNGEAQLE